MPSASHRLCRRPKPAFRTLSVSFPNQARAAPAPQPSQWAGFAHSPTPKGRCFIPTKTHLANTSAIDGLVQLGVYLLAPRADYVKAVSYAQGGALRSNTPFRVRPRHLGVSLILTSSSTIEISLDEETGNRIPRPSAYGLASESIFLIRSGNELSITKRYARSPRTIATVTFSLSGVT